MSEAFHNRVKGMMPRSIYILKCQDGFYYVGESSTENLELRIRQQFGEKVGKIPQAKFCADHKPEEVVETHDIGVTEYKEAEMLENAWTKIYVGRYCSDKVRGGISCLDEDEKNEISSDTKEEILGNCEINGLD